MQEILEKINEFFGDDMHITIENKNINITVGTRTLTISMPSIIGASSMG